MTTDSWLAIIAIVQVFGAILLAVLASAALARGRELGDQVNGLVAAARTSLINLDSTVRELREARLVEKAAQALAGASGAVGRIDPLATELSATLSGARDLLDDVAQTSQSVRARVDNLAATQHELNALTGTLADVAAPPRRTAWRTSWATSCMTQRCWRRTWGCSPRTSTTTWRRASRWWTTCRAWSAARATGRVK